MQNVRWQVAFGDSKKVDVAALGHEVAEGERTVEIECDEAFAQGCASALKEVA
jgi:hypothetical protein